MLVNTSSATGTTHVKFVSYTGKYPCLCTGLLTLEIDGKEVTFGNDFVKCKGEFPAFWQSGGYLDKDYNAHCDEWQIDVQEIPEQFRPYAAEIDRAFNDNVRYGCCGGCA